MKQMFGIYNAALKDFILSDHWPQRCQGWRLPTIIKTTIVNDIDIKYNCLLVKFWFYLIFDLWQIRNHFLSLYTRCYYSVFQVEYLFLVSAEITPRAYSTCWLNLSDLQNTETRLGRIGRTMRVCTYLSGMMKCRRDHSSFREFCRGVPVISSLWLDLNSIMVL